MEIRYLTRFQIRATIAGNEHAPPATSADIKAPTYPHYSQRKTVWLLAHSLVGAPVTGLAQTVCQRRLSLPSPSVRKFREWSEQGRLSTTKTRQKRGRNPAVFPIILDEREEISFKVNLQGDKPTLDAILAIGSNLNLSMAFRFGAQYIAYKQGKATEEMLETLAAMSAEFGIKIAGIKPPKKPVKDGKLKK